VIKKLAAIFAFFAIAIIFLNCALAGDTESRSEGKTRQFRLGQLALTVTERSANGDYLLKFSKDNEELIEGTCAFKTHEPKTFSHAPIADCRTLLAYCFSGGAHCCTTLFVATECGTEESLDMVDLGHAATEVQFITADSTPEKQIKVLDWQFAYYGPEDAQIQLSFADSPAMTRLLVFDRGHWRADRAGEFSSFYSGLLHEAVRNAHIRARRKQTGATASLAIQAAYYDLMSGRSVEEASEVLSRLFPDRWKSKSAKIAQDVSRAASEFNPVETIR